MVDTSTVEEAPTAAMEAEVAPARRKVSSHLEQILSQMNILKAERAEQEKAAERTRLDFEAEKKKYAEGAHTARRRRMSFVLTLPLLFAELCTCRRTVLGVVEAMRDLTQSIQATLA